MSDANKNSSIEKDKVLGKAKEAVGKVSGNESLELEGKMQSLKSDVKEKMNIDTEEIKEGIAGAINDGLDKIKAKNDKNQK